MKKQGKLSRSGKRRSPGGRLLALLLALATLMSLCTGLASAADSEEEALGAVDIYNGGYELGYLSINGRVQKQRYTYYNYVNSAGQSKEIPAYCVNPNLYGVPQTVAEGESIEYLADEKASDPKVLGIVANGYPTRGLAELGLENKYQAYYATKMALWCYILPTWDVSNLKVAPGLTGVELTRAQKILAAAKDIYVRGTAWNELLSPEVTCTPDRDTAYPVTIDGKSYKQQVFTFWSKTWVCDYRVDVAFTNPDTVPAGTRLVDLENRNITSITTSGTGDGYAGQFKVLYPADAVAGESGSVQLSFHTNVYRYGVYYAVCAEKGKYGELQNYMVDTDPTSIMRLSAYSSYADTPVIDVPMETGLKILKLETDSELPLSGALFEVIGPDGATVGTFSSNGDGEILIPLTLSGNYTVIEKAPPSHHLLGDSITQNVNVEYGKVATVTFYNAPYGTLTVEKRSNTGMGLPGAVITIRHIESGKTYTAETNYSGRAIFSELQPGAYRIQEQTAPSGWKLDDTVYTATVVSGETSTVPIINEELPGLRIIKYDRLTYEAMSGVTFEVFRDAVSLGKFCTDEFGEILLTNAQPGTYRAVEVDTGSDGHILDTTPQEVELATGDGIKDLLFFNNVMPGLHLVKVDSTDPSKVIPNAVFEVKAVAGDYGPQEFTTDKNGEIDLSKLPPGAYLVTEKSCPGYVIDQAQRIIQLDPNEDAQFVFTNSVKPSLQLIKTSADGSRLSGVTFQIARIADGSHYLDRTTNTQGEILISDLEPGVYSVKETATTLSHLIDPREYHVELFPGQTSTVVLQNDKRPNLTIHKNDADTGEPIAGTVFTVRAADGSTVTEVKTGADGTAAVENLLPIVYEVTEKSVPVPYLLDAPSQLITLRRNHDSDLHFENHKKPSLTVNKVDSITGDPIKGAKFQVWYGSNNTETGALNNLGIYYSDENGQFTLSAIRDGWYKVTELEPAAGYAIKDPATQECFVEAGKGKTLTFENTPLSAIVIRKVDSDTGKALAGAWFRLRFLGTTGTGGTVIGEYQTSANGSIVVTGLKAGTYIVEEIASGEGHIIGPDATQTVYLSGEGQDVVTVTFGNAPMGSLLIKKIDSATHAPLSGVEFMVTGSDGTVIGSTNGKFTTDSAGSILISNLDPGLSVVVKETRAKEGYLLDDTPQTAKIIAGETVTLEFRNAPKGGLIINKLDSVTGKPLEGVSFRITYADGSYVPDAGGKLSSNGLYYTDKNGQIILSGITGTLVVTEEKSIDGYTIDEATHSQTVVVNSADTQSLTFYNAPVGGLELIKVNQADKSERIPNVTFEIRKMDGALVDTVTTDKRGRVFLHLDAGDYYAVEVEAADGFKLDDTPTYFTVRDGKTTTLTVTNKAFSGILLHKIDSATRKGIYGVTFLLYDGKMNPVEQFTTDQRGYAYIDTLELSGKVYLRELDNEGYIVDEELKTVYVRPGETTEITWENTAITGQIQITKKSANYNPTTGLPAGTPLEGAVFEITDKAGNVVDTIRSDSRGLAVSKPLPLSRYTIREVKAPEHYGVNEKELTAYLEHAGQIVRFEVSDKSMTIGVSITKTGPAEIMAGQPVRYAFSGIANTSNVRLDNFYWRDTIPAEVRLDNVVTGTYNFPGVYKITYRVNGGETQTLADNLSTGMNYTINASAVALGLAANERVTEVMFVFGQAPAGFAQVEKTHLYCTAVSGIAAESFVNVADVGGSYNGKWVQAVSRWVTKVYGTPVIPTLPRTGY